MKERRVYLWWAGVSFVIREYISDSTFLAAEIYNSTLSTHGSALSYNLYVM